MYHCYCLCDSYMEELGDAGAMCQSAVVYNSLLPVRCAYETPVTSVEL